MRPRVLAKNRSLKRLALMLPPLGLQRYAITPDLSIMSTNVLTKLVQATISLRGRHNPAFRTCWLARRLPASPVRADHGRGSARVITRVERLDDGKSVGSRGAVSV